MAGNRTEGNLSEVTLPKNRKPGRLVFHLSRLVILFGIFLTAAASCLAGDTPAPYAASDENRAAAAKAFQEIDALLAEASRLSGLPIRSKVKSAISSRDEVQRYIRQRMAEASDAKHAHGEELALKKFGLIPPDYPLQASVLQLLTEQAAAYYDPRRKQIFIADWTPIAVQRPAIVHELTHALQDQAIKLDAFLDDRMSDDEQMARSAVVEGQAVVVMMEYLLAQSGMKLDSVPNLDQMMSEATLAEVSQFPVFAAAPPYLRESLLFPYTTGMQYVRWMKQKYGPGWFATVTRNAPETTSQVMHPGSPAPAGFDQISYPDIGRTPPGYERVGEGRLGELDLQILLKQYCGAETAARITPAWRGLRYAVYENRKENRAFLVHRSRWQDAEAAADFVEAYKKVLAAKGEKSVRWEVEGDTISVYEGLPR